MDRLKRALKLTAADLTKGTDKSRQRWLRRLTILRQDLQIGMVPMASGRDPDQIEKELDEKIAMVEKFLSDRGAAALPSAKRGFATVKLEDKQPIRRIVQGGAPGLGKNR